MIRVKYLVLGVAVALQFAQLVGAQTPDAQRKEHPLIGGGRGHHEAPIGVVIDAQKKEAPNTRPISIIEMLKSWAGIVPDAQRKE